MQGDRAARSSPALELIKLQTQLAGCPPPSPCTAELWHWHSYRLNPPTISPTILKGPKTTSHTLNCGTTSSKILSFYLYFPLGSFLCPLLHVLVSFPSFADSQEALHPLPKSPHTVALHQPQGMSPCCSTASLSVMSVSNLAIYRLCLLLLSSLVAPDAQQSHTHTHALSALSILLNVSSTYCSCEGKEGRLNQTEDRLPSGLPWL